MRRTAAQVLCRLGRHAWQVHHNPELGWDEGAYELCRRCSRERQVYDLRPTHDTSTSFAAGMIGGVG